MSQNLDNYRQSYLHGKTTSTTTITTTTTIRSKLQ